MPIRRTVSTKVPSPYGNAPDRVERVVDTIAGLYARGNIDTLQKDAAERYERACAILSGAGVLRCALASEGVRVAPGSRIPNEAAFGAVRIIRQVADVLGLIDGTLVHLVCAECLTIRQAACRVTRSKNPSVREVDLMGARLRSALGVLADLWFPSKVEHLRVHRDADARPLTTMLTEVLPAAIRAVHASKSGVFAPA